MSQFISQAVNPAGGLEILRAGCSSQLNAQDLSLLVSSVKLADSLHEVLF